VASEGRTMGENIRPLESLGPSRRQSAARRARHSRAYSWVVDATTFTAGHIRYSTKSRR